MGILEIVLIIVGVIVLALGYILPARREESGTAAPQADEEQIKKTVAEEVDRAKIQIKDIADETVTYSMEKTERAMERLTNEKIMAVSEYSDTVLETIHKNHKEAVFLYDMLNEKHDELVATVGTAAQTIKEIHATLPAKKQGTATPKKTRTGKAPEPLPREEAETVENAGTEKTDGTERTGRETEFIPISPERVTVTGNILTEKNPQEGAAQGETELSGMDITFDGRGENNNERILSLHKAGKSRTAIAKELGLGVGEVKLVIDLFEGA